MFRSTTKDIKTLHWSFVGGTHWWLVDSHHKNTNVGNIHDIDGLVQDCAISIANALKMLQSCTEPSTWCYNEPRSHHTKQLSSWLQSYENSFCPNLHWKHLIRSQFCTSHDGWAVAACAELWLGSLIVFFTLDSTRSNSSLMSERSVSALTLSFTFNKHTDVSVDYIPWFKYSKTIMWPSIRPNNLDLLTLYDPWNGGVTDVEVFVVDFEEIIVFIVHTIEYRRANRAFIRGPPPVVLSINFRIHDMVLIGISVTL